MHERTCAACGDPFNPNGGRSVLCGRCVQQPAGYFSWSRTICRHCRADVAVTPKGWTVAHHDRRTRRDVWDEDEDRYLGEVSDNCTRYKVDENDPALRAPRTVAIDYQSTRRKVCGPSLFDAAKAVVHAADTFSDHDARYIEIPREEIETLRRAVERADWRSKVDRNRPP